MRYFNHIHFESLETSLHLSVNTKDVNYGCFFRFLYFFCPCYFWVVIQRFEKDICATIENSLIFHNRLFFILKVFISIVFELVMRLIVVCNLFKTDSHYKHQIAFRKRYKTECFRILCFVLIFYNIFLIVSQRYDSYLWILFIIFWCI